MSNLDNRIAYLSKVAEKFNQEDAPVQVVLKQGNDYLRYDDFDNRKITISKEREAIVVQYLARCVNGSDEKQVYREANFPLSMSALVPDWNSCRKTMSADDFRDLQRALQNSELFAANPILKGVDAWRIFDEQLDGFPVFFDFKSGCDVSYLPANRPPLYFHRREGGHRYTKSDQKAKIGKAVRLLFGDTFGFEINDSMVEDAVNRIASHYAPVQILRSHGIGDVYNLNTSSTSPVGASCMQGKGWVWINLQQLAPVEVLYSLNCDGELESRALLWTLSNGRRFLDRIYSTDKVRAQYIELAKAEGWLYKERQAYDRWRHFIDGTTGESWTGSIEVNLEELTNSFSDLVNGDVPFLDTMCTLVRGENEDGVARHYLTNVMEPRSLAPNQYYQNARRTNGNWGYSQ